LPGNIIAIKIKDEKIYRKCKFLVRINGLVIETLLKFLFERVNVMDIQRAYIEGGEEGVVELIRRSLGSGNIVETNGGMVEVKEEGLKKGKSKGKNGEAKGGLDMESFW
jgi:hypothetical protein